MISWPLWKFTLSGEIPFLSSLNIIENSPVVKCNSCGKKIPVSIDLEYVSHNERQMGVESMYEGSIDGTCPKCINKFTISITLWEYLDRALSNKEVKVAGVEIVEGPRFSA